MQTPTQSLSGESFYQRILDVLQAASVEFLVGGAVALRSHTGIERDTKDFDLMLRPRDVERAMNACREAGFRAGYAFSHWIAKIHLGEHFIDLIYRAGNGLCEVDDGWFASAGEAEVFGRTVRICPPEEMIWQKAYIMERERFDGADIQHLFHANARTMDWERLLDRFQDDWQVLFSHLVLFGYIYPGERNNIPASVIQRLITRLQDQLTQPQPETRDCFGTLLSRAQYLPDVERWNYHDIRLDDRVKMTPEQILEWTTAIDRMQRAR